MQAITSPGLYHHRALWWTPGAWFGERMESVRALAAPPRVSACVYALREACVLARHGAAVQQDQKVARTSVYVKSGCRSTGALRADESGRRRNSRHRGAGKLGACGAQTRKL